MGNIIGIYKITNPKGRIYIGQSKNITRRFNVYKNYSCKNQTKLYRSFQKHGVDSHFFEVICECKEDELDEKERFYISYFNCFNNENGLNLLSGGKNGKHSNCSKEIMSKKRKGKKLSEETKRKIAEKHKGIKPFLGRSHSEETKKKLSLNNGNRGKKLTVEQIQKRTDTRRKNGWITKKLLGGVIKTQSIKQ